MTSALAVELPVMAALALAPFVAGTLDPQPGLWLSCLVWIALLLRFTLPGLPRPTALHRMGPAGWLVGLFVGVGLISAATTITPGSTVLQLALWISYAALWWLTADIAARGGANRLIAAVLLGAFFAGALGLREHIETVRQGDLGWRSFGQFANPNFFAGFLTPAVLLVLAAAFLQPADFKPWMWTLALALVTAAIGGALLATGSRGGLLSLGVGLGVFVVLLALRGQARNGAGWGRLVILMVALGLVALGTSGALRGRGGMGQGGETHTLLPAELCPEALQSSTAESNRFRVLTWRGALAMGGKRPVTGWGPGSFEPSFERHAIADYTRHAHNTYLQLFAEEGAAAPVLLVLLGLVALVNLIHLPRTAEWGLLPGVGGALAAAAAHNVVDSLLYIPANALLFWTLLGLAAARVPTTANEPTTEAAAPADPPAANRERRGKRRDRGAANPSTPPVVPAAGGRLLWSPGLILGIVGLVFTGSQAIGCMLMSMGRAEMRSAPNSAAATLRSAASLLPWDYRLADEQRRAYRNLGEWDAAVEAGLRSVRYAPDRAAGYDFLAVLRSYMQRDDLAQETLKEGLRHTPNNVKLLYHLAQLHLKYDQREDALQLYRRIAAVDESPVGQVRALPELREYRYARARAALAADADRRGQAEFAFEHRRRAACLLGERRQLHDNNPLSYLLDRSWSYQTESELRSEEEALWARLAKDYRAKGDEHRASLCEEMIGRIPKSREKLREIREQFPGMTAD